MIPNKYVNKIVLHRFEILRTCKLLPIKCFFLFPVKLTIVPTKYCNIEEIAMKMNREVTLINLKIVHWEATSDTDNDKFEMKLEDWLAPTTTFITLRSTY